MVYRSASSSWVAQQAAIRRRRSAGAILLPRRTPALLYAEGEGLQQHATVVAAPKSGSGSMPAPVVVGQGVERDIALPIAPHVEARLAPADSASVADNYSIVCVPFNVGSGVFAVVTATIDVEHGLIWGFAAFLITIIAMRDEDWNRLVAKFAEWLQPPKD